MKSSINALIERLSKHDWLVLGRAITIVENSSEGCQELLEYAEKNAKEDSLIIGITGSGGAGKSTLIDKVIQKYRNAGKTVGVLAVDPSSPYTGGAMLGDRVRMNRHNSDEGVFIRSFANRGTYGGISHGAKAALYLYKAFGFDVIIIESLGVGQAETDITNFSDVTTVVMAPGNGDSIQLAKAGTQEIADIFVINKADKPEAETLYMQLLATFGMEAEKMPMIVKTSATEDTGVDELIEQFEISAQKKTPLRQSKKELRIVNEILGYAAKVYDWRLKAMAAQAAVWVMDGKMTTYEAGEILGNRIILPEDLWENRYRRLTMKTHDCIMERRSVRRFNDRKIDDAVLDRIMEAAVMAPSAVNLQPWYFVVIRTDEAMEKLKNIMADVSKNCETELNERFASHPEVIKSTLGFISKLGNAPVVVLAFEYMNYPSETKLDAKLSVAAAVENLLLAAHEEGVASCWLTAPCKDGFEKKLQEIFAPEHGELVSMVTLGYADKMPKAPKRRDGRYTYI